MVRAWRSADAAACRAVSNPARAGFSEKYNVFPLSILGHCFNVVSLGKALHPQMLHLTQVKMSSAPGRTEMAMCMISSMRRNGCRTVCSPWS